MMARLGNLAGPLLSGSGPLQASVDPLVEPEATIASTGEARGRQSLEQSLESRLGCLRSALALALP